MILYINEVQIIIRLITLKFCEPTEKLILLKITSEYFFLNCNYINIEEIKILNLNLKNIKPSNNQIKAPMSNS